MGTNTMTALVMAESRHAAEGEPDLTERLRKCMKAAHNHWMVLDEPTQLRGAVAAAVDLTDEPDKTRLSRSWERFVKLNNALGAASNGVPVDFGALLAEQEGVEPLDIIPIMALWSETA